MALDFSRIEAGKLDMEVTDFFLDGVLENLFNLVGFKAMKKGIELILHLEPDIPTALIGEPLRLGQILINLSIIAVKFTETGEIVISVAVQEEGEEEVLLHFSVRATENRHQGGSLHCPGKCQPVPQASAQVPGWTAGLRTTVPHRSD